VPKAFLSPAPTDKRALSEGTEEHGEERDAGNGAEKQSPARRWGIEHQGGLGLRNGS